MCYIMNCIYDIAKLDVILSLIDAKIRCHFIALTIFDAKNSDTGSDTSDEDVSDIESEQEGSWFSVVNPQTFPLPEPDLQKMMDP